MNMETDFERNLLSDKYNYNQTAVPGFIINNDGIVANWEW